MMNQKQHYQQVPNLNLIPVEFQSRLFPPRRLSLSVLLAALIAAGIVANALLYREHLAITAATGAAQKRIDQANPRLAAANLKREDAAKIQTEIDAIQRESVSWKEDFSQLQGGQGWPRALATIFGARTRGVALTSIVRQGTDNIAITGNASSYSALLGYRNQLLSADEIGRIISLVSEKAEGSFSFAIVVQVKTGVRR